MTTCFGQLTTSHLYKTQNKVQRSANNISVIWDPMKIIKYV